MASELGIRAPISTGQMIIGSELQFSIPINSLTATPGCKQYLEASDCRKSFKKIDFEFPDIKSSCPVCSRPICAVWKGYYSRHFYCPILEWDGRIWIRKGYCKSKKIHFSMLPDFCIPYLRWSKFIFVEFLRLRKESFFRAFDWDISFSTLYWLGALLVKLLRINSHLYLLPPPDLNSIDQLKNYSFKNMQVLLLSEEFNWNKKIIPSAHSPPP